MNEKLEKIKMEVTQKTDLHISRIPKNVKKEFLELANGREFLGDYGFYLKYIIEQSKEYQKVKKLVFGENFGKIEIFHKNPEKNDKNL